MTNHQMTMLQIKSDLLDLWTAETALQSYEQWFEALKPKLLRHFDIEEADHSAYTNKNRASGNRLRWKKLLDIRKTDDVHCVISIG